MKQEASAAKWVQLKYAGGGEINLFSLNNRDIYFTVTHFKRLAFVVTHFG